VTTDRWIIKCVWLLVAYGFLQFAFTLFMENPGLPEIVLADRKTFLDWKWHAVGDVGIAGLDFQIAFHIFNRELRLSKILRERSLAVSGIVLSSCIFLLGYWYGDHV